MKPRFYQYRNSKSTPLNKNEESYYSITDNTDLMTPIPTEEKFTITVSPWALSKEDITVYVNLRKDFDPKKITLLLPECVEIKDTINIQEYSVDKNRVEIKTYGKTSLSPYHYFGLVIATKDLFKELAVKSEIKIEIVDQDQKKYSKSAFAKIFRPLLEFSNVPTEIVLKDNQKSFIPLDLSFSGFGDIGIRLEATIGGNLVSEGESIVDRVLYGLLREGFVEKDIKENELNIEINKNALEKLFLEFKEKLNDDAYMEKFLADSETREEAAEFMKKFNEQEQEKYMLLLYDNIEGYLIRKLTDILTRSLSSNLHMDSPTKIKTEIQTQVTNLILKVYYKDLLDNEYDPLITKIKIIDQRKNDNKLHVEIPIEIEHVDETNAYKNVGMMQIGSIV